MPRGLCMALARMAARQTVLAHTTETIRHTIKPAFWVLARPDVSHQEQQGLD